MKERQKIDLLITSDIADASSVPSYITLFTVPEGFELLNVEIDIATDTAGRDIFDYKGVKFRPSTVGIDATIKAGLYKELCPLYDDMTKGGPIELDDTFSEKSQLVLVPEGFSTLADGDFPVTFGFRVKGDLKFRAR